MFDSVTLWTQAPLSVGFPRQEFCSGLLFSSPGDLPDSLLKLLTNIVSEPVQKEGKGSSQRDVTRKGFEGFSEQSNADRRQTS